MIFQGKPYFTTEIKYHVLSKENFHLIKLRYHVFHKENLIFYQNEKLRIFQGKPYLTTEINYHVLPKENLILYQNEILLISFSKENFILSK